MENKFISNKGLHCVFSESGIYWRDYKNINPIFFPYSSIKGIFCVFGFLYIKTQNRTYIAVFSYKESKKIKDAVEYVKNIKKISTKANSIETTKNSSNQ